MRQAATHPGTVTDFQPRVGTPLPPKNSGVHPAGERPEELSPCSCLPSHRIAKRSDPIPFDTGSTSVSVIALASAASTALPPAAIIDRPACAASGCDVATMFRAKIGFRRHEARKVAEKGD